ncbi:hypothetical protein ACFSTC_17620 [Nonomuraea ferruginea]
MVAAGAALGYSYYAVTDHAPDLAMQRMTLDKALEQRERVAALQARHPGMRLLHGTELNIAPDGSVDWPGEILRGFDVCVASVHSHFTMGRDEMTRRFIAACEKPVRRHHRPPDHPQDRQARHGRRRLGRRLPRRRPHGHRHGDRLLPRPLRPA